MRVTKYPSTPNALAAVQTYAPPSSGLVGKIRSKPFAEYDDWGNWPFSRDQRIVGAGSPFAVHSNKASSSSETVSKLGVTVIMGTLPGATRKVNKEKRRDKEERKRNIFIVGVVIDTLAKRYHYSVKVVTLKTKEGERHLYLLELVQESYNLTICTYNGFTFTLTWHFFLTIADRLSITCVLSTNGKNLSFAMSLWLVTCFAFVVNASLRVSCGYI